LALPNQSPALIVQEVGAADQSRLLSILYHGMAIAPAWFRVMVA